MAQILTARVTLGNNLVGISSSHPFWPNTVMDLTRIRRENLRRIVSSPPFDGNQAALAEKVGVKPPQISRWLSTTTSDPRAITEASARKIEQSIGKPKNWMDEDHADSSSPDTIFLKEIEAESRGKDIPEHIKKSILTLIASSPKREEDQR